MWDRIALIAVGALAFVASSTEVQSISAAETYSLIQGGTAILIDVREEVEIKDGMAEPARWMPLSRMKEGDPMWDKFLSGTSREKLIIFYCGTGRRSNQAALKLKALGYTVANMGGYSSWVKEGLPMRTPLTSVFQYE